ncbi:hypothetical protein GCM10010109_01500 [Actinoplanes campanulatus]|nr:hypothetical protein GCM10010109_01500 [Actinoplanes campanulatus]GID34315.1 hypothetical protein Aca09nite_08210 [Actinoplanes campanulatus]
MFASYPDGRMGGMPDQLSELVESPGARPAVGVGMVLLRPDGAVLLGRRIKRGETPTWCLPGGHLEHGESFEHAAERETLEEAGLTVAHPRAFGVALNVVEGGLAAGVAADFTTGEPHPLEPHVFERWEWHSSARLPQPLFPATAALLSLWSETPPPPGWRTHRFAN